MPTVTFAFFSPQCVTRTFMVGLSFPLPNDWDQSLSRSEEEKINASWSLRDEHRGNTSLWYGENCWQCLCSLPPMCVLGEKLARVLCRRPYHVDAAALLSLFWKFSKYLKDLSSWLVEDIAIFPCAPQVSRKGVIIPLEQWLWVMLFAALLCTPLLSQEIHPKFSLWHLMIYL